jgi:hypothetical protein
MDYKKYKPLINLKDLQKELSKDLTKANYNPGALAGDDGWSLSEMVGRDDRESITAAQVLHGQNEKGGPLPAGAGIVNKVQMYKLRVMTRQGCTADEAGNKLVKNPAEIGFVEPDAEPIPGDQVWVRTRPLEVCPDTDRQMDRVAVRNDRIRRGKETWEYETYVVDDDHCIVCPVIHAYGLLTQNGWRLVGPEFQKYNTNIQKKDDEGRRIVDPKRRVSNWWYKEVPLDYAKEKPKKRAKKKQQEETPVADLTFPHEME